MRGIRRRPRPDSGSDPRDDSGSYSGRRRRRKGVRVRSAREPDRRPRARSTGSTLLIALLAVAAMLELVVRHDAAGRAARRRCGSRCPRCGCSCCRCSRVRRFPFAAPASSGCWPPRSRSSTGGWSCSPTASSVAGLAAAFLLGNLRDASRRGSAWRSSSAARRSSSTTIPAHAAASSSSSRSVRDRLARRLRAPRAGRAGRGRRGRAARPSASARRPPASPSRRSARGSRASSTTSSPTPSA